MRIKSTGKIAGLIAAAAMFISAVSANAAMEIYTGTSPLQTTNSNPTTIGVVGTIKGTTGNQNGAWDTFTQTASLQLLGLAVGGSTTYDGAAIYANTVYDYFGSVDTSATGFKKDGSGNTSVPSGYEFVLAKYDGQNAGYVLFYLGGNSVTLPVSPANYWTDGNPAYGISGWIAFNPVPEPTTMIAGALLLLPFGASTIRFLRKNRTA